MTIGRFTSPRTKSGFIRSANGPSSQNRHTQITILSSAARRAMAANVLIKGSTKI
jgi:hypothetical protein